MNKTKEFSNCETVVEVAALRRNRVDTPIKPDKLRMLGQPSAPFRLICWFAFAIANLSVGLQMTNEAGAQDRDPVDRPRNMIGSPHSTGNNMLGPIKQDYRNQDRVPRQTIPVRISDPQDESEQFVNQRSTDDDELRQSNRGRKPKANDPLDNQLGSSTESKGENPLASFTGFEGIRPVLKVVGGLCVVIAIFFAFTLISKRTGGKTNGKIPDEILQILARMPLDQKRQFQLVRFGSKLLLLSVADKNVQTISEISDPIEVEHVLSLIHQGRAAEAYSSFRRITGQMRQQRRAQRMYPSQIHPETEISESPLRVGSNNVFEA